MPVTVPQSVEFKLPTTAGFPWLLHLILELSRRPTCPDFRPPKYTPHDLRHSYASHALALGESLTMIGRLLGHAKIATTARYAHLAAEPVKYAANDIAKVIAKSMG